MCIESLGEIAGSPARLGALLVDATGKVSHVARIKELVRSRRIVSEKNEHTMRGSSFAVERWESAYRRNRNSR